MNTRIEKITPDTYRVFYSIFQSGEASCPFATREEAAAFAKGLRYAFDDIESHNKITMIKAKIARQAI